MRKLFIAMTMTLGSVTPSGAASSTSGGDAGLLVWLFIGFIALFIVSQLVPGILLTVSLLRGLFSRRTDNEIARNPSDHVM